MMNATSDQMNPSPELPRAALVFALAGVALSLTLLPSFHGYDTGEFVAVSRRLDLSHAPGHPLHALFTHGLQLLPLGDHTLRASFGSALALALALAGFYGLLRRLVPAAPWGAAAVAALLPLAMPALWLQGVRPEVYALQLMLAVLCARLAWEASLGEQRALPALALAFGLAGANHSLIGATLIPVAIVALIKGQRRLAPYGAAVGFGALGLLTYAYLPLRGLAATETGWGLPVTVQSFIKTLTASDWQRMEPSLTARFDLVENCQRMAGWTIDQVGPVGGALGLLALLVGLLAALRRHRAALVGASLVAVASFASKGYFWFDGDNPDVGGYLAPALLALVALGFTCAAAVGWKGRLAWGVVAVAAFAAPRFDPGARLNSRFAEGYARAVLDSVPPEGALVVSDYSTQFGAWALRASEGARPDVAVVFRGRVKEPWFAQRLATQAPRYAKLAFDFPRGFTGEGVRFEPGVLDERLGDLGRRLLPAGLLLTPAGLASKNQEVRDAFAKLGTPVDLDARRAFAFLHLQHGRHLAQWGQSPDDLKLGRWHLDEALALAPGDELILAQQAELKARERTLR